MIIADLLFYVFSALLLLSGAVVISARNAVHSVLFLILAFFNAAGLFVLMGAEYVAMLLVIVYVGAVAVLFLFVVMMLDVAAIKKTDGLKAHIPAGMVVGAVLLTELVLVFRSWVSSENAINNRLFPAADRDAIGGARALGDILYTNYLYPFQMSGLILLVAMIGAITLCLRLRGGIRRQKARVQVTRRQEDSMEIVHVDTGKGVEL
jgi:NADH-quinone oxidoreductase subunit J